MPQLLRIDQKKCEVYHSSPKIDRTIWKEGKTITGEYYSLLLSGLKLSCEEKVHNWPIKKSFSIMRTHQVMFQQLPPQKNIGTRVPNRYLFPPLSIPEYVRMLHLPRYEEVTVEVGQ